MAIQEDDGRAVNSLPGLALHRRTVRGICIFIMSADGIMSPFRFVTIRSDVRPRSPHVL
jgi:hypothetical protein